MSSALVLLAHGSREPEWARPLETLRRSILRHRPALRIELAYLELMAPGLPEVVARLESQGVGEIRVLPVFLGQGSHLRLDLPALADSARATHPSVTIQLLPSLGEQPEILDALACSIAEVLG